MSFITSSAAAIYNFAKNNTSKTDDPDHYIPEGYRPRAELRSHLSMIGLDVTEALLPDKLAHYMAVGVDTAEELTIKATRSPKSWAFVPAAMTVPIVFGIAGGLVEDAMDVGNAAANAVFDSGLNMVLHAAAIGAGSISGDWSGR